MILSFTSHTRRTIRVYTKRNGYLLPKKLHHRRQLKQVEVKYKPADLIGILHMWHSSFSHVNFSTSSSATFCKQKETIRVTMRYSKPFSVSGDHTHHKMLRFDCAHALKLNNGSWICAARETASTSAGSANGFSRRCQLPGANQKERGTILQVHVFRNTPCNSGT